MSLLYSLLNVFLLCALVLAAFADRVYTEAGRFFARGEGEAAETWEREVEPRLRLSPESAAASASVLRQICFGALAVSISWHAALVALAGSRGEALGLAAFELLLVELVFDRLLPQLLWTRTGGGWLRRLALPIAVLFYLALPVTLSIGLVVSIAGLAEPDVEEDGERPHHEAMEALLEAGEEEGILEESDRELVRSVVEFGDKVVREVMTPRPEILAVPGSMSLADFTAEVNAHNVSRVPVYGESLDDVSGIAFARDLLGVDDREAATRTVASLQRPAVFVPETKKVNELLREMQRQKQHMSLVIDEYGGVAGLITIEDLLEAIVGEIQDEHDEAEAGDAPVPEEGGTFVVPGSFEVTRLRDLLAAVSPVAADEADVSDAFGSETSPEDAEEDEADTAAALARWLAEYDATTVGGLVSEMAGHIPLPGEVVEDGPLRLEVLASTDRLVERVRVGWRGAPASSEPE